MQIKEIKTKDEIASTHSVLKQIYEDLKEENFVENIQEMMASGYRMAGVFENKTCIGVAGIRIIHKIQFGKIIEIEDFMIHRAKRGIGVGKMLLRWVDWQALEFNCTSIIGNLLTKRQESQKIFAREKFILEGFLFKK